MSSPTPAPAPPNSVQPATVPPATGAPEPAPPTVSLPVVRVLLPILAVQLIGSLALDLAFGSQHLVILNGVANFPDEATGVSAVKLALMAATWLVALTAGSIAAVGVHRGRSVDPRTAVVVALRNAPALALGMVVAAGGSAAALWVGAGIAGAMPGVLGVVVLVGVLGLLAMLWARLLLGVVTRVFGGSAWGLTRGRQWRTAGLFVLVGMGLPLLAGTVTQHVRADFGVPVVPDLVEAVLLVVAVAVQARLLASSYLLPRESLLPAEQLQPRADLLPREPVQAMLDGADLDVVDARLAAYVGSRPRWLWLGVSAMLLPVLVSFGIAQANPGGAPVIRTADAAGSLAVAWPPRQHPIIATLSGTRFCNDDACDSYVMQEAMPMMDGWSTTTIGPDGGVVTAADTGGPDAGGPFIEYARCTRAGCQHGWLPARASAKEPVGALAVAGSTAPDGSVWFTMSVATPYDGSGPRTYRFFMIHCAQLPCTNPERHLVGTMDPAPQDDRTDGRRARISVGVDGRPVGSFWLGMGFHTVTCDPVTCAHSRSSDLDQGPTEAVWQTPVGLDDVPIALKQGTITIGDHWVTVATAIAPQSGAMAVHGDQLYITAAEASTDRQSGLHITIGTPQRTAWQQVLWRCDRSRCAHPVRIPLGLMSDQLTGPEMMAVGPNGRVLIVRTDRTILIDAGYR